MKLSRTKRARLRDMGRERWTAPNALHAVGVAVDLGRDNPRNTLRDAHHAHQQSRAYSQEHRIAYRASAYIVTQTAPRDGIATIFGYRRGRFAPPVINRQDWRIAAAQPHGDATYKNWGKNDTLSS